ncbi:hypothetical protein BC939DRAFT_458653 [Gamsiella multidivaricata]|uniref:uncharacterized protein n=1 Tax=Gamsiella multidivaricata TaxID=101098 RepID=UPI00221F3714|nr:uncharacterized protein BC939DRAFT_458653 [Gamsiella multidivaricata]KAI7819998.1 hypothetical protein BC939DRAFT_458653 [Gamsiella multidivaricata]
MGDRGDREGERVARKKGARCQDMPDRFALTIQGTGKGSFLSISPMVAPRFPS